MKLRFFAIAFLLISLPTFLYAETEQDMLENNQPAKQTMVIDANGNLKIVEKEPVKPKPVKPDVSSETASETTKTAETPASTQTNGSPDKSTVTTPSAPKTGVAPLPKTTNASSETPTAGASTSTTTR